MHRISPELPLRLGLGLVYLYSGINLISHPTAWVWALPYWLRSLIDAVIPLKWYLQIQGGIEIVFAIVFLTWFLPRGIVRIVAFLSTLEFLAILILAFAPFSEANFLITFRDMGLLGASVALMLLITKKEIRST